MAAAELGSGSRALAVTAQNLKDVHNSLKNSVAEPKSVRPKLFETCSRSQSRNYILIKFTAVSLEDARMNKTLH